jgi:hypothetical protein
MGPFWNILRVVIAAFTIVAVSELSKRSPRWGALVLSLPLISILAMLFSWQQHHDLAGVSKLARDTLILVPLGLPLFIPLAFAERLGLSFTLAFLLGVGLATATVGTYLYFAGDQA